jgi:hypothetical protein
MREDALMMAFPPFFTRPQDAGRRDDLIFGAAMTR